MAETGLRVLLVEDEDADALLVEEALADPSFGRWAELIHVRSLEHLHPHDFSAPVDCALLDLGLPGCSGLEALHRFLARCPDIPTVVLTGRDAEDTALAALAAGALDYVTKQDVSPRVLRRAVRYALERNRMRAQLTDANARLDQFTRYAAHDLRTPLSVVLWSAEVLHARSAGWSDSERRVLGAISTAAQQALTLVDDLLAYSQAGELPLESVELDKLVGEVKASLRPNLEHAGATIEVPVPLPVVAAHPVALRHVLRNLFVNALAYRHPDRPPVVVVTAEAVTDHRWRVAVADNGIGIPPDKQEVIFEPGVRLAPAHAEGSGLGLSAVRTLVERHGGDITVNDNPSGSGTRFLIDLPRGGDGGMSAG